jgi:hypothetical protein
MSPIETERTEKRAESDCWQVSLWESPIFHNCSTKYIKNRINQNTGDVVGDE